MSSLEFLSYAKSFPKEDAALIPTSESPFIAFIFVMCVHIKINILIITNCKFFMVGVWTDYHTKYEIVWIIIFELGD